MSCIPPALAYLVIYNPTLRPNPEESLEGRDEDDVTEQAHILFYTARERAVSRDRILRQVGLAKALANFAEMFTSRPGFDNVHAQKSRLVMISPEPNFWIHACVNLAKTPKATSAKGSLPTTADGSEDFEYHSNSLNDDLLRTQLMQAFQTFKLQYGGFTHIMQVDGVRALERRVESFFTPWAWQWNLSATPEFGAYLGLPLHPLKNQLAVPISDYASHFPNVPTLMLSPPNLIAVSALSQISPLPALAHHLENLVPPPKPKTPPSALSPMNVPSTSTPKHMLAASGQVVTKYITKPAAQVVDPRNWSWPAYMNFGKGSAREKGKERGRTPTFDKPDVDIAGTPGTASNPASESAKTNDHLAPPVEPESISRASGSVSPSTVDHESLHESLLDAQQESRLSGNEAGVGTPVEGAPASALPDDSGADSTTAVDPNDGAPENVNPEEAERAQVTPRVALKPSPPVSVVGSEHEPDDAIEPPGDANLTVPNLPSVEQDSSADDDGDTKTTSAEPFSDASQPTPPPATDLELPIENIPAVPAAPTLAPIQVEFSTHLEPETTSGELHVWLDSLRASDVEGAESGNATVRRNRVAWIAVPGLLVASILEEDEEGAWRKAAQELLVSVDSVIQSRQLTAAEATLRALSTTKVVAHYPAAQMSASSALPQFVSESPLLFSSARALQFSTAPTIREIITHTRWGTWCAARQSTIGTRVYVEVDRKDANLVDVDQELGSAYRRWDEADS